MRDKDTRHLSLQKDKDTSSVQHLEALASALDQQH